MVRNGPELEVDEHRQGKRAPIIAGTLSDEPRLAAAERQTASAL
jgi:hypothetical protein